MLQPGFKIETNNPARQATSSVSLALSDKELASVVNALEYLTRLGVGIIMGKRGVRHASQASQRTHTYSG